MFENKNFIIILIIFVALSILKAETKNSVELKRPAGYYRLPNDTIPLIYNLSFIFHKNSSEFIGLAQLEIKILNETNKIVLNSKSLNNFKVSVFNKNDNITIDNIIFDYENETNFLIIKSENNEFKFEINNIYVLTIKYDGGIAKESKGIYHCDHNEEVLSMIATQFEPTFARTAFPCYDEPNFKAYFILKLTHANHLKALSNMPLDGEPLTSDESSMTTTTFQKTPLMSSYLLAFVLVDYFNETRIVNNITHTVYFPNSTNRNIAEVTAYKSSEIIDSLENLLNFKYPLEKMDHIGVPVAYGMAMENWGLITYQIEKFLIIPECNKTTDWDRIITMTHETVHQWFGNLVSPKWWTWTWLNEGFATYYSYIIANTVFPKCKASSYYHLESLESAFVWANNNRLLSAYVETEEEIIKIFDPISYHVGAAVIRMTAHSLTIDTFQKGIHNYLEKFQYGTADEDDLIDCLEKVAIRDNIKLFNEENKLRNYLKTWTQNADYPKILVTRNYETGEVMLTQMSDAKRNLTESLWQIPITFTTSQEVDFLNLEPDFMMPPNISYTFNPSDFNKTLTSNDWIILNKQSVGYFTVNYDYQNWKLIVETLKTNHRAINLYNRIQIIRDIPNFLSAALVDIEIILEVFSYLKFEEDIEPFEDSLYTLSLLNGRLMSTDLHELFIFYARDIVTPVYLRLKEGNEEYPALYGRVRENAYHLACELEIEECLKLSYNQFLNFSKTGNYKQSFDRYNLCGGVKYASDSEMKMYLNEVINNEEVAFDKLLEPVICTNNVEHIKMMLELCQNFLKNQTNEGDFDFSSVLSTLSLVRSSNEKGQQMVLDFMLQNVEILSKDQDNFPYYLETMSINIRKSNTEKYTSLAEKLSSILNEVELILDSLGAFPQKFNKFIKEHGEKIKNWLTNYKNNVENSNNIENA